MFGILLTLRLEEKGFLIFKRLEVELKVETEAPSSNDFFSLV